MTALPVELDDQGTETVHPKNTLNDLTAREWIARTISVFTQKGLGKGSTEARIERQHPAPFSYQDVARFIEFFTKRGGTVLDPFGGVGSTLKAAVLLGRNGVSIELNPHFAELTRERMSTEVPEASLSAVDYRVIEGDARVRISELPPRSIDYVITSPPYWGILNKVDHKARQERVDQGLRHNYGQDDRDLSHIEKYDDFVEAITDIFDGLKVALKPGKYITIIVGDFRHKDRYYLFHSDIASALEKRGSFKLKGCTIIYQKFKRVFPYGYPYSFVPNLHHQYAMIFQRSKDD